MISVPAATPEPAPKQSNRTPSGSDKLMMLAATAARMAITLLTFVALARFLGPVSFGVIATAIAYCTFIGIVTDFGLAIYTLRTAALTPDRADLVVRDALLTKVALSSLALLVGAALAAMVLPTKYLPVYLLVFIGTTAYSFGDLSLIVVRARRRFDIEAKLVVLTSVVLMLGVIGVAASTRDMVASAIAYAVTRLLYVGIILIRLRGELWGSVSTRHLLSRVTHTLNGAKAFAVDSILTSLSGQIDVLLFGAILTAHDIGIYQGGARLVQAIMPISVVLSTVYMPALAAAVGKADDDAFRENAFRLNAEFTLLAIFAAFGFVWLGPIVTGVIYGSDYDALIPLWEGFGVFALLRFVAASYGIQLAALGHIRTRIAANIITITGFTAATAWFVPAHGLEGFSWLLALSGALVLLVLGGAMLNDGRSGKSLVWSLLAILITALVIIFS